MSRAARIVRPPVKKGQHWVYALACNNDRIYVGETEHLFRRFNAHIRGSGAICTKLHKPHTLLGLYKIRQNLAMVGRKKERYTDALDIETYVTELFMLTRQDRWWTVRGGKHTKEIGIKVSGEREPMPAIDIVSRPLCDCGRPCELTEHGFVCAAKEIHGWSKDILKWCNLKLAKPCDFASAASTSPLFYDGA